MKHLRHIFESNDVFDFDQMLNILRDEDITVGVKSTYETSKDDFEQYGEHILSKKKPLLLNKFIENTNINIEFTPGNAQSSSKQLRLIDSFISRLSDEATIKTSDLLEITEDHTTRYRDLE